MIISDLQYLEISEETIEGGRRSRYSFYENDKIKVDLYVDADISDNTAVVTGNSYAYGNNTFTKIDFTTKTTPYSSSSSVYAVSATD